MLRKAAFSRTLIVVTVINKAEGTEPMLKMRPRQAAAHLIQAYAANPQFPPLTPLPPIPTVQKFLTREGVLIIPGINEAADKVIVAQVQHTFASTEGWSQHNQAIARSRVLKGFARRARQIVESVGTHRVQFIIGHSLGAGIAQILGNHYNCPTMCFSSPAVFSKKSPITVTDRGNILNVQMSWDWLPTFALPENNILKRFGPEEFIPAASHLESRHSIEAYFHSVAAHPELVPTQWPDSAWAPSQTRTPAGRREGHRSQQAGRHFLMS